MYHGWVCDSADANTYRIIANDLKSYNRVVEAVVASNVDATIETANDRTADAEKERQKMIGSVCQTFLEDTASQLTEIGLEMLAFEIPALSPQVFFRNNHFSTILKTEDSKLWMLVTDQGYADEAGVVWESIDITGDSILVNDQFHPSQNDNAE